MTHECSSSSGFFSYDMDPPILECLGCGRCFCEGKPYDFDPFGLKKAEKSLNNLAGIYPPPTPPS